MRTNLLRAHGTRYLYRYGPCRCLLCKAAESQYQRAYREAHPDEERERKRQWRSENPETALAACHRWRDANPERLSEHNRRYRESHPASELERHRRYRREHRESVSANRHRYYVEDPQRAACHVRNRRARSLAAPGTHTARDVRAQYEAQRGRCYWCRKKLGPRYHVDHAVPLALGGSNGPENLVIACAACNLEKGSKHPMDFAGVLL